MGDEIKANHAGRWSVQLSVNITASPSDSISYDHVEMGMAKYVTVNSKRLFSSQ
jgi:hypothetical protein